MLSCSTSKNLLKSAIFVLPDLWNADFGNASYGWKIAHYQKWLKDLENLVWNRTSKRRKEKLVVLPGDSLNQYRSRDVGPNQAPRRNSENPSKCHKCRPYGEDQFQWNVDHSRDVGPKYTQQIMLLCLDMISKITDWSSGFDFNILPLSFADSPVE
jgi:hypothetical protein